MKTCHLNFPEENLFTPTDSSRKKPKKQKNSFVERKFFIRILMQQKVLISLHKDHITGFYESEMSCTYTDY